MATDALRERSWIDGHDLMFVADTQVVYHCHHFNLFFDQTIDDALGVEESSRLKSRAAREASRQLLLGLRKRLDLQTPAEVIRAAESAFAAMGHGRLHINVSAEGGEASGEYLHYGYSWKEKYGAVVRRSHPIDAFATGFIAATTEVAFSLDPGAIEAREIECIVSRAASRCRFLVYRTGERVQPAALTESDCANLLGSSFTGLDEERVSAIASGLKEFTAGVAGDDRGLIQAFGVFVTMHLASYYNRISFDAVHEMGKIDASLAANVEELLRESGRQCGFNTFGGILRSAEWESLVGPPRSDPKEIVTSCLGIARALGFGHWTLHEFEPGERIVVRTPATYETSFYRRTYGASSHPRCYILQGAMVAVAHLAHGVVWEESPSFDEALYQRLLHGTDNAWDWSMPTCHTCGDTFSEIVVTRRRS